MTVYTIEDVNRLEAENRELKRQRDDLAALVRGAVYQIRRNAAGSEPAQAYRMKCLDYLTRNGLQGSPLREV